MSNNVNKVIIVGRLTRDPEAKQVGESTLSTFSVAAGQTWKDKNGEKKERVEFINCTVWGKLGEICNQYLKKGKLVYIEGRLQTDKYEKEGQTHYATKVIVSDMKMLSSKLEDGGQQIQAAPKQSTTKNTPSQYPQEEEINVADIPF